MTPPPRDAPLRALSFMLLAATSFAAMNAMARGLRAIPWPMLALARALFGLAVALAVARARGGSLAVRDRATMWERSVFGSLGMLCTFYALTHMPLGDATALLNTTPLWIALLARYDVTLALPAVERALADGRHGLQPLLRALGVRELTLPGACLIDWDSPGDLAAPATRPTPAPRRR